MSRVADCGRIVGASAVCYYHIGTYAGFRFSEWGEYAVTFFIILSGIAFTGFSKTRPKTLSSYGQYLAARVRAVFPIFLAVNCIIFLFSYCYPSTLGRPFSFAELVLSGTGLSQYCNHRYLSTVMWFIPVIMQAYLVLPIVDAVLDRVSAVLVIVAAFIGSIALIVLVSEIWPSSALEFCRNWSVIFRMPEVCIGVILGRCVFIRSWSYSEMVAFAVFAFFSFELATTFALQFPQCRYLLSLPWNGLIVAMIISTIAMAAAAIGSSPRGGGFYRLVGAASFPFFLMHGIGISFVFRQFGSALIVWSLYFALCWAAAILLVVLFRRTEKANGSHFLESRSSSPSKKRVFSESE